MKINRKQRIFFVCILFMILILTKFLPENKNYAIWKNEYKESVLSSCCELGVFDIKQKDNYIFLAEKSTVGKSRLIFTERKKVKGIFYFLNENFLYKIEWTKVDLCDIEIVSAFKIDNGKYIKLIDKRKK